MADSTTAAQSDNVSFARQDTAKGLASKLRQFKNGRASLEREWDLNLEFYKGNQYAFNNPKLGSGGQIVSLPIDNDSTKNRVRLVSNQMLPGTQSLIAQLTKTKPTIHAAPGTGANASLRKAQVAERLYEYWWQHLYLRTKLQEALTWATISQGYWKITWDKYASDTMKFLLDPHSMQPIVSDDLAEAFRAELQQAGVDARQFEKDIALGEIRVEVLSGKQVLVDPTANLFADAKWAVCTHAMSPDEIRARWGKDVQPDSSPQSHMLTPGRSEQPSEKTTKNVHFGYFLPGPGLPDGRYVTWIEGPDEILEDGKWKETYPHHGLPLIQFPGVSRPGSVYDEPLNTHARPIQKELNRTISQIVEYKNLTLRPRVWAPIGSVQRRKLTTEVGQIIEYQPIGGQKPEIEQLPSMPPYIFEHLKGLQDRLDRLYNMSAVSRGEVPPNVEAGVAIDLLQETAVDMMSPTISRMEEALCKAGKVMVSLAKEYYIEPRMMKIIGSGGVVQVHQFQNSDIDSDVDFYAEAGSGIPRTRAGRESRILSLVNAEMITPKEALKHMDVADLRGISAKFAADEDRALREHDKILKGEPLNTIALHQAIQTVNTPDPQQGVPVDPDTGQPFQSQQEVESYLHHESLKPTQGEDWDIHLDQHALTMKGVEFEQWPPDKQIDLQTHWQLTLQEKMNTLAAQPGEPPKVSYQIKGTAGPTSSAKILNKSGIQVTPDDEAELPLETWVTDSMDKADADDAGNDPQTALEQQQHQADQALHSSVIAAQTAATKGTHDPIQAELKSRQEHEKLKQQQLKTLLESRKASAPLPHQQKKTKGG